MKLLIQVNERFYSYFDKDTKMLFTLSYGDRGIYGAGKAWYLSVTYDGARQTIATFSVQNDGHNSYKNDYQGRLWYNSEAIAHADHMVGKMLGR